MVNKKHVGIAFCWFRRKDYPALLAIFTDPETLPADYDDWVARFKLAKQATEDGGLSVISVPTRPDEFVRFCDIHAIKRDNAARIQFAIAGGNAMIARRAVSN